MADECKKLERLRRYISRPAIAEKRLALTPNGNVRYQLIPVMMSAAPENRPTGVRSLLVPA